MAIKTPTETLAACMVDLQKTYIEILDRDDSSAYEEVGLTLRSYSDSLAIMVNPYEDTDDEFDDE